MDNQNYQNGWRFGRGGVLNAPDPSPGWYQRPPPPPFFGRGPNPSGYIRGSSSRGGGPRYANRGHRHEPRAIQRRGREPAGGANVRGNNGGEEINIVGADGHNAGTRGVLQTRNDGDECSAAVLDIPNAVTVNEVSEIETKNQDEDQSLFLTDTPYKALPDGSLQTQSRQNPGKEPLIEHEQACSDKSVNILLGAGKEDVTSPLKAAKLFTEKHLPDINCHSVLVPEEIVDLRLPTQFPIPIAENERLNNNHDAENRRMLGLERKYKGNSAEIGVFKYIQNSLGSKLCAIFLSFYQMNMFVLTGGDQVFPEPKNCEFDIVVILPEYYKIIVVEVKSHKKHTPALNNKVLEQVDRGRRFCSWLKMYACEDRKEEFHYIPVLAVPNIKTRSDVKLKEVVVISSEEMNENFLGVLMKSGKNKMTKRTGTDLKDYRTIVQLMFSSCHAERVNKLEGGFGFILEPPEPAVDRAQRLLVGEEAGPIGAGFSCKDSLKLPIGQVQLSDLKNKPLGSLESIIFWNPTQLRVLRSFEKRKMIVGDYGTGKTLLLMALALRFKRLGKKVAFVVDGDHASEIFQAKMKMFCKENGVEFFNELLVTWNGIVGPGTEIGNYEFDDKKFKTYLRQNKDHCFVIDELDSNKMETLFEKEFRNLTIACSVHPTCASHLEEMKIQDDWKIERLSNVMRNSSNIFSLACHSPTLLKNPIHSVIGPKPKLIGILGFSDIVIGLVTAIKYIKDDKFVLLFDDSECSADKPNDCWETDFPMLQTASAEAFNRRLARTKENVGKLMDKVASVWKTKIQNKIKNVDLYYDGYGADEDVVLNFLRSEKGCLMTPRFEGMESKSLIYVTGTRIPDVHNLLGESWPILRKDLASRATVDLVIIHDVYSSRKVFNKDLCDLINPYEEGGIVTKSGRNVSSELKTLHTYTPNTE